MFQIWGNTLDSIKAFYVDAIASGRDEALLGKEGVELAMESTKDLVNSTCQPALKVATAGGTLKDA